MAHQPHMADQPLTDLASNTGPTSHTRTWTPHTDLATHGPGEPHMPPGTHGHGGQHMAHQPHYEPGPPYRDLVSQAGPTSQTWHTSHTRPWPATHHGHGLALRTWPDTQGPPATHGPPTTHGPRATHGPPATHGPSQPHTDLATHTRAVSNKQGPSATHGPPATHGTDQPRFTDLTTHKGPGQRDRGHQPRIDLVSQTGTTSHTWPIGHTRT